MESQRDPDVMSAHRAAGLVACDGAPMVWACRWAGVEMTDRVTGRDFMLSCLARAELEGWTSFFYGGKPGVSETLAAVLRAKFPELKVAGTLSPPFRPVTAGEDEDIVEAINAANPDLVWIGLSTPKQELWMASHRSRLAAPALFGVGAAFDFLSGELPAAPRWMQRSGLEWLFRMAKEPKRLTRRYLRNNPAFIRAIARQRPILLSR
jgi:N-acetylglucosaminyldiphosphoundecaprenol N-acetyl-beta-D-mannosaminyltransferase